MSEQEHAGLLSLKGCCGFANGRKWASITDVNEHAGSSDQCHQPSVPDRLHWWERSAQIEPGRDAPVVHSWRANGLV